MTVQFPPYPPADPGRVFEAGMEGQCMADAVRLLMRLGITANYKGYWYILTSLDLINLGQMRSFRVTKDLYPKIAQRHDASPQNVERAIRTVIGVCWDWGNRELLCSLCSCSQRPTNATFIASLAASLYLSSQDDGDIPLSV